MNYTKEQKDIIAEIVQNFVSDIEDKCDNDKFYEIECINDNGAFKYAEENFKIYDWAREFLECIPKKILADFSDMKFYLAIFCRDKDRPYRLERVGEVQKVWARDVINDILK